MILITGGAGYIGSHINKELNSIGQKTVIYDNLVYGHKEFLQWGEFEQGDLSDVCRLREVFSKYNIEAVMHFAAYAYVGESVENPEKYYFNNLCNTLNLLKVMHEYNVGKIVFSSTCATYGNPISIPITEEHIQSPINAYGNTKYMIERVLEDYRKAYGLKYVILRYFNAAGADPEGQIGEWHTPETHLIPLALDVAIGKQQYLKVFGSDYDTPDGTCIRDYIHVNDLAAAHILALRYMNEKALCGAFNLGNGKGFSIREIIEAVERVTGEKVNVLESDRRSGDPPILIGSSQKALDVLGWKPIYNDIDSIISTAWDWHKKLNKKLNNW